MIDEITIAYTDTKLSHRFLRFSTDLNFVEHTKERLKGLTFQVDEDIVQAPNRILSHG
jgi:hypothetical protein